MSTEKPIGHAPGVLCYIRYKLGVNRFLGDNGKIVKLLRIVRENDLVTFRALNGFNRTGEIAGKTLPTWEFETASNSHLHISASHPICVLNNVASQTELIPLGDSSLLDSDELTMEQQHVIDAFDKAGLTPAKV